MAEKDRQFGRQGQRVERRRDGWPWFSDVDDLAGFDRLRTPIWVFDVEQHAMWWGNQSALVFWGAESLAELRARDFSSDSQNVRDRLRLMVSAEGPVSSFQEGWTLYPKGQPITIVADIAPVWIEEGRRALMIEASYPIDLKQDPDALRILEAARNTPLLVSTFTLEGQLLVQNVAAAECYGTIVEKAATEALFRRFCRESDAAALLQSARDDRTLQSDFLVSTLRGERWHRVTAKRGRDPVTGQFVFVLTEEDISDHVVLEKRLEEANRTLESRVIQRTGELEQLNRSLQSEIEERTRVEQDLRTRTLYLSTILENAPMAIVLKDRDGRILAHGRNWLESTPEQFPDNAVGLTYESLVDPDRAGAVLDADRRVMVTKAPMKEEGSRVVGNRRLHWLKFRFPLIDEQGEVLGTCSITSDITEQKEAEAHMAYAQKMEALGQLTGGVAHDFNNLLAVIHGNAELLAELDGFDDSLTNPILHAAQRGSELTQRLLAFSRRQALQPRAIDLAVLLDRMLGMLGRTLGETIEIEAEIASDLWQARADPGQVENALINLILNARDALPNGGRIKIQCTNAVLELDGAATSDPDAAAGDFVVLAVSDDGVGMPQAVSARAFEPFFTTKGPDRGSGLGLAMVYGFARQSGGQVTLDSREEGGTSVKLYLPRDEAALDGDRSKAAGRPRHSKGENILVVEDDDDMRSVTMRILLDLGYRVQAVADAEIARQVLSDGRHFDLLLSDVVLPGNTDGAALAREARAEKPDLKVLLMSGYAASAKGPVHKSAPFLAKPFRRNELASALREILD